MNCDRIAGAYRWLEYLVFGKALVRCRTHYLDAIGGCRHALLLGDGDGRFLERCLSVSGTVSIHSVDSSEKMQDLAHRRAAFVPGGLQRVRFSHSDARVLQPVAAYDLIVTHFFLDCLTEAEIDALAARIQGPSRAKIRWIVSEFRIPPDGPVRPFARALIGFMYACFRLATGLGVRQLPDHRRVLNRHGFQLTDDHRSLGGLLISELWER